MTKRFTMSPQVAKILRMQSHARSVYHHHGQRISYRRSQARSANDDTPTETTRQAIRRSLKTVSSSIINSDMDALLETQQAYD
jgi:hypothetical protein